jgi:hypothetical protein
LKDPQKWNMKMKPKMTIFAKGREGFHFPKRSFFSSFSSHSELHFSKIKITMKLKMSQKWPKNGYNPSVDINSVAIDLNEVAAHIESSSKPESSPCVEVYDSRCTRHITPYCNAIDNFIKISPKIFPGC